MNELYNILSSTNVQSAKNTEQRMSLSTLLFRIQYRAYI